MMMEGVVEGERLVSEFNMENDIDELRATI